MMGGPTKISGEIFRIKCFVILCIGNLISFISLVIYYHFMVDFKLTLLGIKYFVNRYVFNILFLII